MTVDEGKDEDTNTTLCYEDTEQCIKAIHLPKDKEGDIIKIHVDVILVEDGNTEKSIITMNVDEDTEEFINKSHLDEEEINKLNAYKDTEEDISTINIERLDIKVKIEIESYMNDNVIDLVQENKGIIDNRINKIFKPSEESKNIQMTVVENDIWDENKQEEEEIEKSNVDVLNLIQKESSLKQEYFEPEIIDLKHPSKDNTNLSKAKGIKSEENIGTKVTEESMDGAAENMDHTKHTTAESIKTITEHITEKGRNGSVLNTQQKAYSDEIFQDELIFAADIVAEEAGQGRRGEGQQWSQVDGGHCLGTEMDWKIIEGSSSSTNAGQLQPIIAFWFPIFLWCLFVGYMVTMVIDMVDEKNVRDNEVIVEMKEDLAEQFLYFDIMKWP